jgi:anti-sigma B factor antagonist
VTFRPEPFHCEVKLGRASAVVEVRGELDLATVGLVHDALHSVVRTKRSVTLDLRGLTFMDSTGLTLILEIDAMARQDGFNLSVVRAPETVQRIFRISGVEDGLVIIDAPEDVAPPALAGPPLAASQSAAEVGAPVDLRR